MPDPLDYEGRKVGMACLPSRTGRLLSRRPVARVPTISRAYFDANHANVGNIGGATSNFHVYSCWRREAVLLCSEWCRTSESSQSSVRP